MTRAIDRHPSRKKIIDAMLSGVSDRKVAKMAGVSHVAVNAYRREVLQPQLETAAKAHKFSKLAEKIGTEPQDAGQVAALTQELVKSNPFLERAELLWNECVDGVRSAKDAVKVHRRSDGKVIFDGRDFAAFAAMLNQAHRNLELFGRGAGFLRDEVVGAGVENLMIVLPRVDDPRHEPNRPALVAECSPAEVHDVTVEKS